MVRGSEASAVWPDGRSAAASLCSSTWSSTRRCCTASTSAAAFRPPRPTLPLIASGGRIAAIGAADGLLVTFGRSGARRLARRRTQPLAESRRVVFPVPGFATIGKPPVRLAAEKHPLVHGRRIHPDQIPERPCRGLGEAQATVGHVQIDGQAQRVRGERCDGKTIVGARGVRLRNGWRAIRVVDGERDTFSLAAVRICTYEADASR